MALSSEEPPRDDSPRQTPGGLARDFNDLRLRATKPRRGGWLVKAFAALLVVTVIAPVLWVLLYGIVEAPGTLLMAQRAGEGERIRHETVPLSRISPHLVRAVIAAEDARFCSHRGFDVEAIEKAVEYNARAQKRGSAKRRGASTISQQTAKNLFLWPKRSWVRKGAEVYFTFLIETIWPKRRIMEAYLNAVEWGDGVFGAEAAARARFGKAAKDLTQNEAARLAAVLPSPNKWSATSPGPYVRGRIRAIVARANVVRNEGFAACVLGKERATPRPGKRKTPETPPELPPLPEAPPELAPPEEGAPLEVVAEPQAPVEDAAQAPGEPPPLALEPPAEAPVADPPAPSPESGAPPQ
jgi:monofunctional biosynthetic peptidoglycan transglycosylase